MEETNPRQRALENIISLTEHFIALSHGKTHVSAPDVTPEEQPIPIPPARISYMLDDAEKLGLTSRACMLAGNFPFANNENFWLERGKVPHQEIMPAIVMINRRAKEVLTPR